MIAKSTLGAFAGITAVALAVVIGVDSQGTAQPATRPSTVTVTSNRSSHLPAECIAVTALPSYTVRYEDGSKSRIPSGKSLVKSLVKNHSSKSVLRNTCTELLGTYAIDHRQPEARTIDLPKCSDPSGRYDFNCWYADKPNGAYLSFDYGTWVYVFKTHDMIGPNK